jgi:hypothetical protein
MSDHASESAPAPPSSAVALALATSYCVSQAVFAAVKLGVPDHLGACTTSAEIAQATGTKPDMMRRLLRSLAAFDLVEDLGGGKFRLTPVGNCLRADAPNSVRPLALLLGSETFWQTAAKLGDCVTTGNSAFQLLHGQPSLFSYLEQHKGLAQLFNDAMSGLSALTGAMVAKAYDFAGIEHVVDVGGGQGKLLASLLKTHSHLSATLYDLPRVVEGAPAFLAAEGIAERCTAVGGDMLASVPRGGELYLLSRVLHNWDDAQATAVLRSCRRAMTLDARLLILDRVLPERVRPDPLVQSHVLSDLRMILYFGGAYERTATEFEALIQAAGLRLVRIIPTSAADSLIEAVPA